MSSIARPAPFWRPRGPSLIHLGGMVSDGTTGEEWIRRLRDGGKEVHPDAEEVLLSPDFVPTTGVKYDAFSIRGISLGDHSFPAEVVYKTALILKLGLPPAELACLIRDGFPDDELKEMNLCFLVVPHEPIMNPKREEWSQLVVDRHSGPGNLLSTCDAGPRAQHPSIAGFAFVKGAS